MNWLAFDLETDGLLDEVTVVHCACFEDFTGAALPWLYDVQSITDLLDSYEYIVGHNILGYDIPVLQKLLPGWVPQAKVIDTVVLSRMCWPQKELTERDRAMFKAQGEAYMPAPTSASAKYPPLAGRYSLKAWGYRLGILKSDFHETADWSVFTLEMLEYCQQDVTVTVALWKAILSRGNTQESLEIECELQAIFDRQEARGVYFDLPRAQQFYATLIAKRTELNQQLHEMHPGWTETYVTEKKKLERERFIEFNPNSNHHIERLFREKYGWKPEEYTPSGKAKLDERVFESLDFPEAKLLLESAQLKKAIGTIGDGASSYLNCVKEDQRIHGRVLATGTVTGRTAHRSPDLNVPKKDRPYASEYRQLFLPSPGLVMVGADASGLELRCLAHYLARFDGGAYAAQILEGDIHSVNQAAAGLDTRDKAKTFIYAFLYGAGDSKLGAIVGGSAVDGRDLKRRFMDRTRGLRSLLEGVTAKAKRDKFLTSILGRRMDVRAIHSALNTLLQGCGADVMKVATVLMDRRGLAAAQVLHKHDEYQFECHADDAARVGEAAVQSIRDAGGHLGMRCELDGEYQIGSSWAETH